jgi:dienelactone hydrolase
VDVWNVEATIKAGFAVALVYAGEFDPDRADVREGIQGQLWQKGRAATADDPSSIMTWAWGLMRMIDVLEKDNRVDAKRIACVGHSRLGKTVLYTAAYDSRVALAIPHQAGCGGTAPSRGTTGETVQQINDRFPHWFNARFKEFNQAVQKLPFDQHALVALCAPRPVLFTNAVEDTWANPAGQLQVLQAALPVYQLYDAKFEAPRAMPEPGTLDNRRLGYGYRAGKHSMTTQDWEMYRTFATTHMP